MSRFTTLTLSVFLFSTLQACRHREALDVLSERMHALEDSHRHKEALAVAEEGMREADQLHKQIAYWNFFIGKVVIVQARDGNHESLRVLEENGPPSGSGLESPAAEWYMRRAFLQGEIGNLDESARDYQEALALAKQANLIQLIPSIEYAYAHLLAYKGDFDEAENYLKAGREAESKAPNPKLHAYAIDTLAVIDFGRAKYEDALAEFHEELESPPIRASRSRSGDVLLYIGVCHDRLGEYQQAIEVFERIAALVGDSDPVIKILYLGDLGTVYMHQRQFSKARQYLERALKLNAKQKDPKPTAYWLNALARLSVETHDFEAAERYNQESLEVRRKLKDPGDILIALATEGAILAGQGKTAKAEETYQDVARQAAQRWDPLPLLEAHAGLARLYASTDRPIEAERSFNNALGVVDQSRAKLRNEENKIAYFSSLIAVHTGYIDFLMSRGRTERALEIAEATRARLLQERYSQSAATKIVSAIEYRRLAQRSGASLISYWVGPERSYVWFTTARQTTAYWLPGSEHLSAWIQDYRGQVESQAEPLDSEDLAGSNLYRELIGHFASQLGPGARLLIASDGPLAGLNFETLPAPDPKLHYFLEDATISCVPSLNLLVHGVTYQERPSKLLLIGDPNFSDQHYQPLKNADQEMSLVARHFNPANVRSFSKDKAVPAVYEQAKESGLTNIHFTAHATTNLDSPLDSAILLSPDHGVYRLTARDVMKQPLNAELVTISACRAAGARSYSGEGLVGFMWAFLKAGAHNVVAGLWGVSDESTPQLMDRFYAGLTSGEPAATALHNAKLSLLRSKQSYSLPYYWGPFQLYTLEIPGLPKL